MPDDSLWMACPRDVNEVMGLREFVAAWDKPEPPDQVAPYFYKTSPRGQINESGRCDITSAPAIPYWHPQFRSALEPGVTGLVVLLTSGGRWISYTSCEGHFDAADPENNCE